MKGFVKRPNLYSCLISVAVLSLPVSGEIIADEFSTDSEVALNAEVRQVSYSEFKELRELLSTQRFELTVQQGLIVRQQKQIDQQREQLKSVQTQLDQLRVARSTDPREEKVNRSQQAMGLNELVAKQPESTRLGKDFRGSIEIPGTEAAVKIGGFAKMSMVGTLDPLGTDDRFVTGLIPVDDSDFATGNKEVKVSALQSRLGIEIRESTSYGPLRIFIEGDFAGSGDTYRLRHSFGQFRHILAGKTWSTMVDNRATPEEIDFEGINGRIQVRQAQVRYFPSFGQSLDFMIGLEDPAPDVTGGRGVSHYPDIVVSLRRSWADRWHIKTSLLIRQIQATWNQDNSVTDAKIGWGVSVSGTVGVDEWDERDNILFQFNYGDGIGRYINDLQEVGGQDAVFNLQTGKLETLSVFSGYVAYQHWWNKSLRSTLTYSWVDVENLDFQADSDYARTDRTIINLIWSPVLQVDVGGEILWGKRENKDGTSATARQVQFGAKYRF